MSSRSCSLCISVLISIVILGFFASLGATAQEHPKIVFHTLKTEAMRAGHSGSYTLAGGTQVSGDDWSTLIIAAFPQLRTADGSIQFCTATFVGPSVILTAAHCVFDENAGAPSAAELELENWSNPISLTCLTDRRYATDKNRDFSLCHIDIPQAALDQLGITRFDSLEMNNSYQSGKKVVMTGYGCTNVRIEDGHWKWDPANGWLRVGVAHLSTVPGGNGPNRNNYTVVSHGSTMPTLCPGDSGGPLIVRVAAAPSPYRRIIAINQAVDTLDILQGRDFSSEMIGINTPDFQDFLINTYEKTYPADRICGTSDKPAGQVQCR